jgi:hypothetical protein
VAEDIKDGSGTQKQQKFNEILKLIHQTHKSQISRGNKSDLLFLWGYSDDILRLQLYQVFFGGKYEAKSSFGHVCCYVFLYAMSLGFAAAR